ncbi:MAG: murein biosynthesis integral membrane protein MurJ [Propionibacteriaceae bacterium]|jgi:putative peptidoglycan lipid II flippase|nr:murein biosynthesis integral membrane protein MurJ [Propionibacteriaceae bacterium]
MSDPGVPENPAEAAGTPETTPAARVSSKLLSATALMASGTVVSRVLGFVRVLLVAYVLGTQTRQADMFAVAAGVPNMLYFLFAGGMVNAILVPQIVRAAKRDDDGGVAYTNRILTAFLGFIAIVTVLLIAASRGVTWLYSGADWHTAEMAAHFNSMVFLTTLLLPEVFFYGVFFVFGQVLNSRDSFAPMMWAPVANNVVQILVTGTYAALWGFYTPETTASPFTTPQTLVLGLGTLLGVVVQAIILIACLKRVGYRYRPRFDLRGTGLGHTFSVAKWTLAFMVVYQIGWIVVQRLATSATAGSDGAGLTVYNNANLIWIIPHSLLTVALATALLPGLSRLCADGAMRSFADTLTHGMRIVAAAIGPIGALFVTTGLLIGAVMFRGGGGGGIGGDYIGMTLTAMAPGLLFFSLQFMIVRAFYALEDTFSAFLLQIVISGVHVVAALVAISLLDVPPNWVAPCLGLAETLSYIVGFIVSMIRFHRFVPEFKQGPLYLFLLRVIVASLPGALLGGVIAWLVFGNSESLVADLLGLVAGGLVAAGVYLGMAKLVQVKEVGEVVTMVRSKLGR